jgi:hypothetical protein
MTLANFGPRLAISVARPAGVQEFRHLENGYGGSEAYFDRTEEATRRERLW